MIGIFDSGSGGLSVLREVLKLLPGKSLSITRTTPTARTEKRLLSSSKADAERSRNISLAGSANHRGGVQHCHSGGDHHFKE